MAAGGREVAEARARAAEFFAGRQSRAGLLARRYLGIPAERDPVLSDHLVRELRQRTRMDGSTEGSLVKTAWTLLELMQLDSPPDHAAVVRVVGWLLARQAQAGRFGEGCTDERHARGLCQHFLSGFFSPAAPEDTVSPLDFPIGITVRDEAEARFAASCFALRAVLRARQERRQRVLDHLGALLNLGDVWGGWGSPWSPDLVLFALGGVAHAPLDFRERVERLASQVARRQRPDGSWNGAHPLHALDVMLSIPSAPAQAAVRAAVPHICAQARDGTLFVEGTEEHSLIALRALAAG
ncbi:MAG: hypothetical protein HY700_01880 [Gemmatimonadetes bacterium]|nr:hypothetical protein [Gemmatimonadota bacterium]